MTRDETLTLSIPRRLLGNPRRFTFSVAAAREMDEMNGGSIDSLRPATFRYALT